MAINKKLIHFKTFANFNSQKLSANEANTKYTTGISGTETSGNPDILYQSICFIKDTQQIWTHGQIYNASADGGGDYVTIVKFNELFAEGTITTNESDVFNVVKTAMESNTPLLLCDNNYSIIQVSYYPLKVGSQIICSGLLYHDIYDFSFTPNSNQVAVTTSIGATKNESDLVEAQGIVTIDGTTYALPNTDAEAGADEVLLTYDTGVYKNKDYEGYDLGVVDGLYEERNGYPWALPNSDFSGEVGLENTLASKGDTPSYYILRNSASPSTLELMGGSAPTRQEPGNIIAVLFSEQFQQAREHEFVIEGNAWMLSEDIRVEAKGGDTMLFVFSNDYIIPVGVYESFYAKRAEVLQVSRTINGVYFNGSSNITNYTTCSTAAATAAKTASVTGYSLLTGSQVRVKFNNANTASAPTLNITSTGAKSMRYKGVVIDGSNFTFDTTKIYTFTYTGNYYDLEGDWDQGGSSVDAAIDGITFDGTTDITRFAMCDTAANTVAKTVTIEGFKVATGARISLYMQNGHSMPTMTLNINSLGAKTVFYGGQSYLPALGVGTYDFVYTSGGTWDLVTNKPKSIRTIGGTTASGALQTNQFFKFSNTLTSLNVSATPTNVPNAEYSCEFTAASTGCTFTYPPAWKWANGIVPTIEAGKTYQLSVTNNCAVIASFF